MKNLKKLLALGATVAMLTSTLSVAAVESGSGEVTGDSLLEGVEIEDVVDILLPTITNKTYKLVLDPKDLLSQYAENSGDYTKASAYFTNLVSAGSDAVEATDSSLKYTGTIYTTYVSAGDSGNVEATNAAVLAAFEEAVQTMVDSNAGTDYSDLTGTEVLTGLVVPDDSDKSTAATVGDLGIYEYTAAVKAAEAVPATYKYTNTADIATFANKGSKDVVLSVDVTVTNVDTNPVVFTESGDVENDEKLNVAIALTPTAKGTVINNADPTDGSVTPAQAKAVDGDGMATMSWLVEANSSNFTVKQEADDSVLSGHKYVYSPIEGEKTYNTAGYTLQAACNTKADWTDYYEKSSLLDDKDENLKVNVVYSIAAITDAQASSLAAVPESFTLKDGVTLYSDDAATTEVDFDTDKVTVKAAYDTAVANSTSLSGYYTEANVAAQTTDFEYTAGKDTITADTTTGVIVMPETDADPNLSTTTFVMTSGKAVTIKINMGSGNGKATGITEITYDKSGTITTLDTSNYEFDTSTKTLTLTAAYVSKVYSAVESREYTITFDNNKTVKFTLTK